MKYKSLLLVLFFLCIMAFSRVNASIQNYSMLGRIIYLDAGHGGRDSGAISTSFLEKDMNLLLVKKLENTLTSKGAVVYLTRDGDYDLASSTMNRKRNDLYNRVKLINNSNCDMYVSMHLNASTSSKWNGIQIFYSNVMKENQTLAETITSTMNENMKNVREAKKENGYYMYSKIKVPGILIEAGFISNANDNYKIRQPEYQDTLINNIVKGIENYFQNE